MLKKDYSKKAKISISPSGAFYYRIFPDYEEQLNYSKKAASAGAKSSPLREKYRKIWIKADPVTISIPEVISECKAHGEFFISLKKECELLWEDAKRDQKFYLRKKKSRWRWPRVPIDALDSKEAYIEFTTKNLEAPPSCPWNTRTSSPV